MCKPRYTSMSPLLLSCHLPSSILSPPSCHLPIHPVTFPPPSCHLPSSILSPSLLHPVTFPPPSCHLLLNPQEQYKFIYNVVLHALLYGNTQMSAQQLKEDIKNLGERVDREFKVSYSLVYILQLASIFT